MHRTALFPRRRSVASRSLLRQALFTMPVLAAATCAPAAHAAATWAPVSSGTTLTITALDHRADATLIGTSDGSIYRLSGSPLVSSREVLPTGKAVTDIAFSPSGASAIATYVGGTVVHSATAGISWGTPVQLKSFSPAEDSCTFTLAPAATTSLADATSVGWASDTKAYVTANLQGSLQETTDGGISFTEIGRQGTGSCRYNAKMVKVIPTAGTSFGYVLDAGQNIGYTSNDFQDITLRSYFVGESTFAVSTTDAQKLIGGHDTWSDDGGSNFRGLVASPDGTVIAPTRDASFVGGTAVWVGDGGDIWTSVDGNVAYRQPADGANATTAWKAVSAASASDVMVAGAGGALVQSTTANSIPLAATPTPAPTPAPTPTPTPTPTPSLPGLTPGGTSTGTLTGATVTLVGPTTCVKANASFTATMSMKRLTIKHNKIVKLRRVDFYVDGKRVVVDTKKPFTQTLTIKGTANTKHVLKAIGYIVVTKGKSPKKTQSVTFQTCA